MDEFVLSPELQAVQKIKECAWGMVSTSVLIAAIRLGLPEAVGDEPATAEALANKVGAEVDTLTRLLDALECRGVFVRTSDGRYGHNEVSRLLREDDPNSVSYLVQWIGHPLLWPLWPRLDESIRTGEAVFPSIYGKYVFDYIHEDDPAAGMVLGRGMTQASNHTSDAIARSLDLTDATVVADIGGGQGQLLKTVLEHHPAVRGVLFDLPPVVARAHADLRTGPLADRVEIVGGDCRAEVPVVADVYLVKNVLEWDDESSVATLANVVASARPGARVVVIQSLTDHNPEPEVTTALDLLLLLNGAGHKHSTGQVRALLERGGLRYVGVRPTGTFLSSVEAVVPDPSR
ncbi:methyltransferase [Virgisporangium ochraceum]|nr:methyltransferase [Virgisporangium ochraceum]